jgi:hypothetical protein
MSNKDNIFKLIQEFLKNPPTIIWGSGATIPYGLPSMNELKNNLKSEIPELTPESNLEKEIGKLTDKNKLTRIKKIIWKIVYKKDIEFFKKLYKNKQIAKPIKLMIEKFSNPHPQMINIVTTNYDMILEYVLAINKFNFTDGFSGQTLSVFNEGNFKEKNIVNLLKVHGSLKWFEINEEIICMSDMTAINDEELNPLIISPSTQKYEEAYKEPFRTLISKSDNIINNSKSFLVIGFGFNDDHLTPKIDKKIKEETPIVILVKKATKSCLSKLENASNYVLIQDNGNNESLISYSYNGRKEHTTLKKQYWTLEYFIEEVI